LVPSTTDTQELVVPKSMPTIFPMRAAPSILDRSEHG
jgi:hypothetical protein